MMEQRSDVRASQTSGDLRYLLQLIDGARTAQLVYVAAKLGIADLLDDGPKSCEELATCTGAHAPSLYRVMRLLATLGIFTETDGGRFALTPRAALLRTGADGLARPMAILWGEEIHRMYGELLYSVRTGKPAFDYAYGMGYWEYLAQHPEAGTAFNTLMAAWSAPEHHAIAAAYDLTGTSTVADIAGGHGGLLTALLAANPGLSGILFDRLDVIENARPHIQASGVADRCELVGGDFFEAVPPGADVYVLKRIIHDWDDERSLAILKSCRRATPDHGKLLVVEHHIPPGDEPSPGKVMDVNMLVWTGGMERTEAEYRTLFRAASFELTRVIPTSSPMAIYEGVPV